MIDYIEGLLHGEFVDFPEFLRDRRGEQKKKKKGKGKKKRKGNRKSRTPRKQASDNFNEEEDLFEDFNADFDRGFDSRGTESAKSPTKNRKPKKSPNSRAQEFFIPDVLLENGFKEDEDFDHDDVHEVMESKSDLDNEFEEEYESESSGGNIVMDYREDEEADDDILGLEFAMSHGNSGFDFGAVEDSAFDLDILGLGSPHVSEESRRAEAARNSPSKPSKAKSKKRSGRGGKKEDAIVKDDWVSF